uniref:Testis cDNA clone: QtsA-12818, similar to human ring finger protein 19 (RNF19), transcript variant 1 n=1 Tax=Macaca fascicularis TaxID=9541 RepID=Q4R413_MACFA|nr:unnamed protein product [Macaca fascicularis]
MYFLGEETLEPKEENIVAAGNTGWCSCRNRFNSWHCYSCNDYWHSCVCGPQDSQSL